MNPNSMLYWYPRVADADVPQPETIIVPVPPGFNPSTVLDGSPFPPKLVTAVRDACAEVGYPAFLRGDLTSGKHGWLTTCYVEGPLSVLARMDALVEASIFGPGEPPGASLFRPRRPGPVSSPLLAGGCAAVRGAPTVGLEEAPKGAESGDLWGGLPALGVCRAPCRPLGRLLVGGL